MYIEYNYLENCGEVDMAIQPHKPQIKESCCLTTRCNNEIKQKVDYAAQLQGVPTSGFMKTVLSEAADRTIRQHEFIELSLRDRIAFAEALISSAPAPSRKAIAAAKRYKKRLGL